MGELPPKLFFRIGEVAGLVGVEPHVLRYWEREFRSIRPTKSAKGQRVYSRKDVENLLRVRDLLYRDGFTIAGAKKKLQRGDALDPFAPRAEARQALVTGARSSEAFLETDALASDDADAALEPEVPDAAPSSRFDADDAAREGLTPAARGHDAATPAHDGEPAAPHVRAKLMALRDEVEAFLTELSTSGPAGRANAPSRPNGPSARTEGKR
ncbi:MAG: MerR family transcriptional regulator [Labilithrix sp.]|nr:MerR family transcriptional regulator [Labilithrix sp.]